MINYWFTKELDVPLAKAEKMAVAALKREGFGILSRIGACNPANAYKAILAEENIGLMLPCNVLVYEKDGKTVVSMIRPTQVMGFVNNDKLAPIASEVEGMLKRAFEAL